MSRILYYRFIRFSMVDWKNGFFVDLEIPFSQENFDAVVGLRNSRGIELVY